jgi:hypothetical protein
VLITLLLVEVVVVAARAVKAVLVVGELAVSELGLDFLSLLELHTLLLLGQVEQGAQQTILAQLAGPIQRLARLLPLVEVEVLGMVLIMTLLRLMEALVVGVVELVPI